MNTTISSKYKPMDYDNGLWLPVVYVDRAEGLSHHINYTITDNREKKIVLDLMPKIRAYYELYSGGSQLYDNFHIVNLGTFFPALGEMHGYEFIPKAELDVSYAVYEVHS